MNIYVGSLSYNVTEEELKQAFEAFGEVESVRIIKDMYSGRSKGFGFVEMPLMLMRLAPAPKIAVVEEDLVVAEEVEEDEVVEDKVVGADSSKRHSDVIKP